VLAEGCLKLSIDTVSLTRSDAPRPCSAVVVSQAPQPAEPATSDCPDVAIYGVRGSGQDYAAGEYGMGPDVHKVSEEIVQRLPSSDSVLQVGVPYPAEDAPWGATNILGDLSPYNRSVESGAELLVNGRSDFEGISGLVQRCPGVDLILVGLSQGAQVITTALAQAPKPTPVTRRIRSVLLYGNPVRTPGTPYDVGADNASGVLASPSRQPGGVAAAMPRHLWKATQSYCLRDDPICTFSVGNFAFRLDIHSSYSKSLFVLRGADFAARRAIGSGSPAAPARTIGPVAFTCGDPAELCIAGPSGSGLHRLATIHGSGAERPSWSPDGTRLAFDEAAGAVKHVYTVDATGNQRPSLIATGSSPAWSPDGSTLAFADRFSNGSSAIATTSADGSPGGSCSAPGGDNPDCQAGLTLVSGCELQLNSGCENASRDTDPAWSPDGTQIVFSKGSPSGGATIAIVPADGSSAAHSLTSTKQDSEDLAPAWSPDGRQIAFVRRTAQGGTTLEVMNADGSNLRAPPVAELSYISPNGVSWTPDSTQVAFAAAPTVDYADQLQIYTLNPKTAVSEGSAPPPGVAASSFVQPSANAPPPADAPDWWPGQSAPPPTGASGAQGASGTTGPQNAPGAAFIPAPTHYVALGDSYASGQGTNDYFSETTTNDDHCHRSPEAYASLLGAQPPDFRACSGATSADIISGKDGETSQLDALDPSVDFVTLSVGGDDLGFSNVLANCIDIGYMGSSHSDSDCRGAINSGLNTLDHGDSGGPPLVDRVSRLLGEIHSRAPDALIYVIGYPRLFPVGGYDGGCNGIHTDWQNWLNDATTRLDNAVQTAAVESGTAEFVDTYSAFDGHEVCGRTSDSEYVNDLQIHCPVNNGTGKLLLCPESFHPTKDGYKKLRDLIFDKLDAELARPTLTLEPGQTEKATTDSVPSLAVGAVAKALSVQARWPGSTVRLTLIDPSGNVVDPNSPGVTHNSSGTSESYVVSSPEPGAWTAELYGQDVAAGGEPVSVTAAQIPPHAGSLPAAGGGDLWLPILIAAGAAGALAIGVLWVRRKR
jgi:Tol biopolymer transport system component/lysophospholipase L1-like esterase